MSVFKACDIRGLYPKELDEETAKNIGAAFGTFLLDQYGKASVVMGRDVRKSGPALKKAFLEGLLSTGAKVTDIGVVATPQVYFAVVKYGFDGGVMITASCNPKDYNGFNLVKRGGESLSYETGIGRIEDIVRVGKFAEDKGSYEERNVNDDYVKQMKDSVKLKKPLKVVIDAANGSAGEISCRIFKELGCEVTELYCEPDGEFPNHPPDTLKKDNLKDLQKAVRKTKSDLGIGYDGDGDRLAIVDSNGMIIENNSILAVFAEKMIKEHSGAHIANDTLCSRVVEDVTKRNGGELFTSRVGHSYLQKVVAENNCLVGGETSGHYMFKDNWCFDDAIYASLKFVEIASQEPIDKLIGSFLKYFTSDDTRIPCPDDKKSAVVSKVRDSVVEQGRKMDDRDGVKIFFETYGWAITRVSNTNPELVLRWEATTKDKYDEIEKFLRDEIKKAMAAA